MDIGKFGWKSKEYKKCVKYVGNFLAIQDVLIIYHQKLNTTALFVTKVFRMAKNTLKMAVAIMLIGSVLMIYMVWLNF